MFIIIMINVLDAEECLSCKYNYDNYNYICITNYGQSDKEGGG